MVVAFYQSNEHPMGKIIIGREGGGVKLGQFNFPLCTAGNRSKFNGMGYMCKSTYNFRIGSHEGEHS